jgi:hypothetical protein
MVTGIARKKAPFWARLRGFAWAVVSGFVRGLVFTMDSSPPLFGYAEGEIGAHTKLAFYGDIAAVELYQ